MSIINQALQKAQRAQLVHSRQETPYLVPVRLTRASRRRWLLLPLGLVAAVGVWMALDTWRRPPAPHLPGETAEPQAIVQAPLPLGEGQDSPQNEQAKEVARPEAETPLAPVMPSVASPPAQSTPASTPVIAVVPMPRVTVVPPPAVTSPAAAPPQEALASVASPVAAPTPIETARAQALVQRASVAQEAGELTRALSLFEQAVKLDPTAKATYNSLGNVYYQQRRYQQAMAMYHKALALDPEYAKARNNLGSTYMQLAMDERAIEELQKVLQIDNAYGLAYYNLACVYARGGHSATAAQYLQQAIALEPQARTWAQSDVDFARVRTAPEVQQLLGP